MHARGKVEERERDIEGEIVDRTVAVVFGVYVCQRCDGVFPSFARRFFAWGQERKAPLGFCSTSHIWYDVRYQVFVAFTVGWKPDIECRNRGKCGRLLCIRFTPYTSFGPCLGLVILHSLAIKPGLF